MKKFIFLFLLAPSFVFASSSNSQKFFIESQNADGFILNIQGRVDFPIRILPHVDSSVRFTNMPNNSSVECVVDNKVVICSLSQTQERNDGNISKVTGTSSTVIQGVSNSNIVINNRSITQSHSGTGDNVVGDKNNERTIYGDSQDKTVTIYVRLDFKLKVQYDYPYCLFGGLKITSNKEQNKHVFFQSLSLSIVRNPDTVNTRSDNSGLGQFIVEEGFFAAIKISDFFHSVKIQNYYPLCLYYITSLISKTVYLDFSKESLLANEDKISINLSNKLTKALQGTALQKPEIDILQSELIMTFNNKSISSDKISYDYNNKEIVYVISSQDITLTLSTIKNAKEITISDGDKDSLFL